MSRNGSANFQKRLSNLLRARFPYLYLSTWEEDRALSIIHSVAKDQSLIKTPRKVFTWSLTTGMIGDGAGKDDTKSPLKALERIELYGEPALFVLKDFHIFFGGQGRAPDFQVVRKVRDVGTILKQSDKPKNVIFISPSLVLPNDIQKDITIVDFDLPTSPEIKDLLGEMIASNKKRAKITIELKPDEQERLAKAALGLTLHEAENAFALAMVEDGRLDISDVEVVLEEKRQIIKKSEILEFIKTDLNMDDVGGLENLKRWLKKRNNTWLDSAQRYCLPAPKGVLITGVPGCGKSLVAKAISAMWQLPLLRLDIGRIFSGILGSSEENMRKAIKTAEAIAPSILWIDEIEKGFSTSNGDGGTSCRIFGSFLTWMQEKAKPVFVIATANNIYSLPPELLRKGRFDEIFFVDLPTKKERLAIFRVHINKRLKDPAVIGNLKLTDEVITCLADLTEGFVGAEIEQVVISALFEAYSESRPIQLADFQKSIRNTVPLSVTQAEQIHGIREWANVRAVAATPKAHRSEYIQGAKSSEGDISSSRAGRTVDF